MPAVFNCGMIDAARLSGEPCAWQDAVSKYDAVQRVGLRLQHVMLGEVA